MFSVLALLLSLHLLYVQATVTLVQKSYVLKPDLSHDRKFYIEDGQCSGFLADVLPGHHLAALQVRVLEPQLLNFATVVLKTPLRSVEVYRKRNYLNRCPGRAEVQVRFSPGTLLGHDAVPSLSVSVPSN